MKIETYMVRQILEDGYALPVKCIPADMAVELLHCFGDNLRRVKINHEMFYVVEEVQA